MKISLVLTMLLGASIITLSVAAEADYEYKAKAPFKFTTLSGKTYEKVRVVATEPDGIRILHADGAAKVPLTELPSTIRQEQGYDATSQAAAVKAVAAGQAKQQVENSVIEFTQLHANVLSAMRNTEFDYAQLDTALIRAISQYRREGKTEWVATLESDRKMLRATEESRSTMRLARQQQALETERARLQLAQAQAQADAAARASQRPLVTSGLSNYGANPLSQSYYYYNPQRLYIYRSSSCYTPRSTPSPYLGNDKNGTGAGGYVPPDMQGGLDGHGGYTPPNLR
jgi:hypothetical protein